MRRAALMKAAQDFALHRFGPVRSTRCGLRIPPKMSAGHRLLTCFLIPLGTVQQAQLLENYDPHEEARYAMALLGGGRRLSRQRCGALAQPFHC